MHIKSKKYLFVKTPTNEPPDVKRTDHNEVFVIILHNVLVNTSRDFEHVALSGEGVLIFQIFFVFYQKPK